MEIKGFGNVVPSMSKNIDNSSFVSLLPSENDNKNINTHSETNSKEYVESLITKLNLAISPFNTSVKFGFDNTDNIFYVSVVDTKSDRVLRRFPAEKAEVLLNRMEEIKGIIFDNFA